MPSAARGQPTESQSIPVSQVRSGLGPLPFLTAGFAYETGRILPAVWPLAGIVIRRRAAVRPRPQRALQPLGATRRSRRADDRPEGSRPYRSLGIPARRRRALPDRDPQGLLR